MDMWRNYGIKFPVVVSRSRFYHRLFPLPVPTMKTKILAALLAAVALTGCSTKSSVYAIGKDTYTLSNYLRSQAVYDASMFCYEHNQHLKIIRERNDAQNNVILDFQCVSEDSPLRKKSGYEVETLPDITIEQK